MANSPIRRQIVKMLGALPLVADFMRRLGIEATVDRLCPSRGNAHLTHGQVVLAILANRLTQPQALYHLLDWARDGAVGETFGFDAALLNDDRLARCLDALALQIDAIQGSVLVQAVAAFGLDLRQLHWDLTSVVLDGAFDPETAPTVAPKGLHPYPQPAYGYGGISDQKQLRVGELVSSDGLVPIFHRSFDGNQADVGTVVSLMNEVRQHVSLPECLVIGDSKLLSADVIQKLRGQDLHFLTPLASSAELHAEFLGLPEEGWKELDYVSQEQAKRPPEKRHVYRGQEVAWTWHNPQTGRDEEFRRLYVISSEERNTCRSTRNRRLVQAGQELNALLEKQLAAAEKAAHRQSPRDQPRRAKKEVSLSEETLQAEADAKAEAAGKAETARKRAEQREKLLRRAAAILQHRHVEQLMRVGARTVAGSPELTWEIDAEALAAAERLDGYYVLLCSWPPAQASSHELLRRWKQQVLAERRFHEWKGPLRVRPVFVTSPKRMAAFMLLLHLALLVFCLIERAARRALAARGETKLPNLLAGHVAAVPTGANILLAFQHLFLIVEEDPPRREFHVTEMKPVQRELWRLLDAQMPTFA